MCDAIPGGNRSDQQQENAEQGDSAEGAAQLAAFEPRACTLPMHRSAKSTGQTRRPKINVFHTTSSGTCAHKGLVHGNIVGISLQAGRAESRSTGPMGMPAPAPKFAVEAAAVADAVARRVKGQPASGPEAWGSSASDVCQRFRMPSTWGRRLADW